MENSAVISVHAQPVFAEEEGADYLNEFASDHDIYWLRHVSEGELLSDVSSVDRIYTDLNGRGKIPVEMRGTVSDYNSIIFTGFYSTECVKRGIQSVQSDFDIYLAENLTYEEIEDEIYSVEEIRSNEEMDDRSILRALYLDTEIEDYLRI